MKMSHNSILMGSISVVLLLFMQFLVLPPAQGFFFDRSNKTEAAPVNNTVTYGNLHFQDRLLFMDVVKKSMKIWGITGFPTGEDVIFPLEGETNNATISYIVAEEKSKKKSAGRAAVISGGVGKKNVTIRFQSQPWGGIDFVVKIYGQ